MIFTPAELAALTPAELEQFAEGLERLVLDREAGKVPWLCDISDCDGKPHAGRPGAHSRANQRPPVNDEWDTWMLLAGRGYGKTRTGAEWSIEQARHLERGALIGPTAADTRDILVEGESGILASAPATFRPDYQPSKRRLVYPNGAIQVCYSADEPDRPSDEATHDGRTIHAVQREPRADLLVVRRAVLQEPIVVVQRQKVDGNRRVDARTRMQGDRAQHE